MTRNTKPALTAATVVVMVLGAVGVATSNTNVIEQRKEVMESVRDALMNLAAIAKKEAPFDSQVVKQNAESIRDHLKQATGLFPEGSGEGDVKTRALPDIWANNADFTAKMEESQAQAEALASVTEEAAFRPAFGKLGNTCKACHTDYRSPEA